VNTGIAEAVAQPSAPPTSTRQVNSPSNATGGRNIPPKRVVVATDDETVDETPPPVQEGSPADRMSAMFDKLMGE
jgi:hypothetical protein